MTKKEHPHGDERSRQIREKAEELKRTLDQCAYDHPFECDSVVHMEQALQSERELALRDAARELNCPDIEYWKPREAVKLVLSLLPSSQTTTKGDKS